MRQNPYHYSTNTPNSCGLTVEEMVATAYFSSKDTKNFLKNATVVGNFIRLINQLHDMRRGYDIDARTDKPQTNIYPAKPSLDNHRCAGGGINSLVWALKGCHKDYNPVVVQREDIERELKKTYTGLIEANIKAIKSADATELSVWASTKKINGELRKTLQGIFDKEAKTAFEADWKGYINDKTFADVIRQGLDNIPFPEGLKEQIETTLLESWTEQPIYDAIKNDLLPLIHVDKDVGYESTLNYLDRIKKDALITTLIALVTSEDLKGPSVQKAVWFLANSKLADTHKNIVIFKLENVDITLGDLSVLDPRELAALFSTAKDGLLDKCIERACYPTPYIIMPKIRKEIKY